MAEVPTVRIDSLHAACDKWCDFPVADRPNAVNKWLHTADARRGEWIFMIEVRAACSAPCCDALVECPPPAAARRRTTCG